MRTNAYVNKWIDECAALTQPDNIVWIDGSEEQTELLRKQAMATGELFKLNEELYPDCYLHRTAINDVARVEHRTFICTKNPEDAGNINNWMDPAECYAKLSKLYRGSMKGQTMYVIPYSMGVVGSEFSKIGMGVGCVIREFVKEELSSGSLIEIPLDIPIHTREVGFVYNKTAAMPGALQRFLYYLSQK